MAESDQMVGDALSGGGDGTLSFSIFGLVVHCLAGLDYQFLSYSESLKVMLQSLINQETRIYIQITK